MITGEGAGKRTEKTMSEQKKLTKQNNILWIVMAIAIVAFCAYSLVVEFSLALVLSV